MEIEQTKDGNTLTLKLLGRLDTTTAPLLEDTMNNSLKDVEKLVLDFKQLEYVSSAGLRVLLNAQKTMNKQGTMVLKNVCPDVNEVLEITGFSDILTIEK